VARISRFEATEPTVVKAPINANIKFPMVRVIEAGGEEGDKMIGILPIEEARLKAEDMELDLVLINKDADPPVCKIIDYGKFKYSLDRKAKLKMKKQARVFDIKEVKMGFKIDEHDFQVRLRAVQRFIAEGDKVKVVVVFKGREFLFKDKGKDILFKIYQPLEDTVVIESPPKLQGRAVAMLLSPKVNPKDKGKDKDKDKDKDKTKDKGKVAAALKKQDNTSSTTTATTNEANECITS